MRHLAGALILVVVTSTAQAQTTSPDCYYVADSVLEHAAAAAEFAFPYSVGQPPTVESRVVYEIFHRTLEDDVRSMGQAWLAERTPQGRRYLRPNGIAVQLRMSSCREGLDRVRAFLQELEQAAVDPEVAAALASFRQNARQVERNEFAWAGPPSPVFIEPRKSE